MLCTLFSTFSLCIFFDEILTVYLDYFLYFFMVFNSYVDIFFVTFLNCVVHLIVFSWILMIDLVVAHLCLLLSRSMVTILSVSWSKCIWMQCHTLLLLLFISLVMYIYLYLYTRYYIHRYIVHSVVSCICKKFEKVCLSYWHNI